MNDNCFTCGKPGHWAKECPDSDGGGGGGRDGGGYSYRRSGNRGRGDLLKLRYLGVLHIELALLVWQHVAATNNGVLYSHYNHQNTKQPSLTCSELYMNGQDGTFVYWYK